MCTWSSCDLQSVGCHLVCIWSSCDYNQLAVTLCAFGHACLGHAPRCVNMRSGAGQQCIRRTSSQPSKRSRQDDKKLQGGGKLQQKLQQDSGDELQQETVDELQQEVGDELQQEVGDVDLKVTLFGWSTHNVSVWIRLGA